MAKPAPMRLQAILDHDAVTAPRQKRSQLTLERILAALGKLLGEKPFEQVSMLEVAERSGCAVTSIYARFKDKWSMIAALHESFREDCIARIDTFLAPERWRGASADEIIAATTAELVEAYHENRHLMHAVLLTDDPVVYARAASVGQHAAERLLSVLPKTAGGGEAFARRVRFAVRAVMAVLQQRVLMGGGEDEPPARGNASLGRELAALMMSYLGYRPGGAIRRAENRASKASKQSRVRPGGRTK